MTRSALLAIALLIAPATGPALAADRPIGWLRSGGSLERDLNAQAARGLRFAAASDGLPSCSVIVMQAPEKPAGAVEYRVVADRTLADSLPGLIDQSNAVVAKVPGLVKNMINAGVMFPALKPVPKG